MRILAVANQKGGVGKTTLAHNLGAGLARQGLQVMLIDLDPQRSLSLACGYDNHSPSIVDVMLDGKPLASALLHVSENLSLVPSHTDFSTADLELSRVPGGDLVLRSLLIKSQVKPDFVILDTPPNLGKVTVAALTAATDVLIAMQCQYLAMAMIAEFIETFNLVQERLNTALQLRGIVATLYDGRRKLDREVFNAIRREYKDLVYETKISFNTQLAEAPSHGKSIFEYAPESAGAFDFSQLTKEFIRRA